MRYVLENRENRLQVKCEYILENVQTVSIISLGKKEGLEVILICNTNMGINKKGILTSNV